MGMEIEIRVNSELWIEIELEDSLGRNMIDQIDRAFSNIVTDANKEKIGGFTKKPKPLS